VPVLTRWLIKFAKNETNANCNSNLLRAVASPDTGNKKENQMLKTTKQPAVPVLTRWVIQFAKNETNANCNSNLSQILAPPRYGK